jgi:hypothetical protein
LKDKVIETQTETIQMSSIKNQGQGQTQPFPEQNQGLGQFPPIKRD